MAVLFQSSPSHYIDQQQTFSQHSRMKKVLGWKQLTALGIGCTIGAGIFVVTGVVAHSKTGPALFLSYIFSGLACLFAAFCYAEMAAMVPGAGSAYAYAHATMGELGGWIIGWDLTLEYAVAAASVAQGWSKYFNALLELMGMYVPSIVSQPPWQFDPSTGDITGTGSILDLPALFITLVMTYLLVRGVKDSAKFNAAMVILKVGIVLLVIIVGLFYIDPKNYTPFMPFGFAGISFFGYTAFGQSSPDGSPVGVLAGSAIVFFAYIGFDAVTCNSEETINPQRDLPIAIILSLLISTGLYVGVSLVLVGMVPYTLIDEDSPISSAFHNSFALEFIIAVGAIVGITSVLLVTLMSQPRILMAIARDGLLPPHFFASIHPVHGTPYKSTILTGGVVAAVSSLIPLSVLVELVSIGTLLAFTIVCISIIVLRRTQPHIPRPFMCPYVPYVPAIGAFLCIMLMLSLPGANWVRLIIWLVIGLCIYYGYSIKQGPINRELAKQQFQMQQQLQLHQEHESIELEQMDSDRIIQPEQIEVNHENGDIEQHDSLHSEHVAIARSEAEADAHDDDDATDNDPHARMYVATDSSAMDDDIISSRNVHSDPTSPMHVIADHVDPDLDLETAQLR